MRLKFVSDGQFALGRRLHRPRANGTKLLRRVIGIVDNPSAMLAEIRLKITRLLASAIGE